ncbi:MAG: hypothetical protein IKA01_02380, partial [Alistipes sp.]|nr:hypothetical protein [Alistipes sp.]
PKIHLPRFGFAREYFSSFLFFISSSKLEEVPVRAEESVKLKTQNFEPTLRSESREYLHSLPSREEETRVYLS